MDDLENKLLEEFRAAYPKLAEAHLVQLAKQKALWERDTERLKPEEIGELILELQLPAIILDLFHENEQSKKLGLNNDYRCPTEFFLLTKKEQDFYSVDTIKPLLSDASFHTIYAYDSVKKGFLTYNIEDANIGAERFQWDGIFVKDILMCWESEVPEELILERGELLGLKHTKEILKSIKEELDNSTTQKVSSWKQYIINSLELRLF